MHRRMSKDEEYFEYYKVNDGQDVKGRWNTYKALAWY